MPRKPGKTTLCIPMSTEELAHVHEIARGQGFKVTSDYVRRLIEQDVASRGDSFTFAVDRGGYRGEKPEDK